MLLTKCDNQFHCEQKNIKALQNKLQIQDSGIKLCHFQWYKLRVNITESWIYLGWKRPLRSLSPTISP